VVDQASIVTNSLLLSTVHKHPLLQGLKLLLARISHLATKHQLCAELPLERDLVVLLHLLVDDRVVMLKVGTEAFGLKGHPQGVLVHGVGVLGPVAKVMCVDGELLAQVLDGLGVFEEEDLKVVSAGKDKLMVGHRSYPD
jgi:hypothetical protein